MQREEFLRTVSTLNVQIMQSMGCHFYKHFNIDDKQLIRRAAREDVYGASTFTADENYIIESVQNALCDFAEELVDWINDPTDGDAYVAFYECDKVLGHGYYKTNWHVWDNGSCECHRIAVVLKKIERKYDTTFGIITCYCEPSDSDIEKMKSISR